MAVSPDEPGLASSLSGSPLGWMVGWSLMALSTQFRSYRTLKVKLYYKYQN